MEIAQDLYRVDPGFEGSVLASQQRRPAAHGLGESGALDRLAQERLRRREVKSRRQRGRALPLSF
jgi:hypothetical protein